MQMGLYVIRIKGGDVKVRSITDMTYCDSTLQHHDLPRICAYFNMHARRLTDRGYQLAGRQLWPNEQPRFSAYCSICNLNIHTTMYAEDASHDRDYHERLISNRLVR
jgi:hypothetical protein